MITAAPGSAAGEPPASRRLAGRSGRSRRAARRPAAVGSARGPLHRGDVGQHWLDVGTAARTRGALAARAGHSSTHPHRGISVSPLGGHLIVITRSSERGQPLRSQRRSQASQADPTRTRSPHWRRPTDDRTHRGRARRSTGRHPRPLAECMWRAPGRRVRPAPGRWILNRSDTDPSDAAAVAARTNRAPPRRRRRVGPLRTGARLTAGRPKDRVEVEILGAIRGEIA